MLTSFGTYLLSNKRKKSIKRTNKEEINLPNYSDRKNKVYHADVENWKETLR